MLKKMLACLLALLILLSTASFLCVAADISFEETKNSAVVLYLNKSNVLVYGKKQYITKEHDVMPYRENGKVMLPVEFFAETISAQVSMQGNEATLKKGSIEATFSTVSGPGKVQYAKADELCSAFSYHLHEETNGIVAYSLNDMKGIFDWTENLYPMRDMLEEFIYDDVSGDELYSRLLINCPNNQHPRLLITDEQMRTIRNEIEKPDGDEIYKTLAAQIVNEANGYLDVPESIHELTDGLRLLYVARQAQDRIVACALAYHLTLDEKYAKRAYAEIEAVCAFPDWNPYHFLDVGEMSAAVALGYDWLYHWMSSSQRASVRDAIEKHAMKNVLRDMNGSGHRTYQWLKEGNVCNWRCVCGGGIGLAMLAMMDEFEGKTLTDAKKILPAMLEALRPEMLLWAPSGAYEEGYSYWDFATKYYSYFMKSLEMTTGSNYGYVDVPGLNMTVDYINALNGPNVIFLYHNAFRSTSNYPPQIMYLAELFNNPTATVPVLERIRNSGTSSTNAKLDILYYDPVMKTVTSDTNKEDAYFQVSEVVTMRNGFDSDDVFVGFHCDRPYGNGASGIDHMDAGMFQIQAEGVEWFFDLGTNNYNVSDLVNTYRFRAEGHNTVIFNPDEKLDMKKYGDCHIADFHSDVDFAYAVGELTDAYDADKGIISFRRGVFLNKESKQVVVQDEIVTESPVDLWWFAHTYADINILDDGRTALLKQEGKTLYATLKSQGCFTVMDAVPLSTSPIVPDQDPTYGIRKLVIHIPDFDGGSVCVLFETQENENDFKLLPLSSWPLLQNKLVIDKLNIN